MANDIEKGMRIISDPDTTSIEQPETGRARQVNGLPLRMLLVSPLLAEAGQVKAVDKSSFADVMRQLAPSLALEVPNRMGNGPKTLELSLHFPDLQAFHPEQVVRQVPSLARLLDIRTLVQAVADGQIDLATFQDGLAGLGVEAGWAEQLYQTLLKPAASGTAMPSSGDSALDRLLGLMDLDGAADEAPAPAPTAAPSSLLGTLIGAVSDATPAAPKAEKKAAARLVANIDSVLEDQANAILTHPDFRQLEGAWRGLKFLVDRIDFRKNILLEVLPSPKDEIDNTLYHQVLLPEHEGDPERPPLSLVLIDAAFDRSATDLAHLAELAQTGESLQVPLIASAAPDFFGLAEYSGLDRLPVLWQHLDTPEYITWHELRGNKASRFLALSLPAFVLRGAYGAQHPVEAFSFDEEGCLFGGSALAVGVSIAQSFAETGWPTHLLGTSNENRLEDFSLWQAPQGHMPLAGLVPESKLGEFNKAGFVVLGAKVNRDTVFLERAPTICLPETYEDLLAAAEARTHITLACQLFVARAAHFVMRLQDRLGPAQDLTATAQEITLQMRAFFHTDGQVVPPDTVWVEHVPDSGLEGQALFAIRLRPPAYVLDREVSLLLGLQVPTS